jgi:hypothetical protein
VRNAVGPRNIDQRVSLVAAGNGFLPLVLRQRRGPSEFDATDGRRETLEGAGISLAKQYSEQGLDMPHEHSQFEDGSVSVEAGLMDMLDRMQTGRFKVFKHLNDWWEEFRLFHRKDGKVVKENDDLMAATRYAVMMLRYARTEAARRKFRGPIEYPRLGVV